MSYAAQIRRIGVRQMRVCLRRRLWFRAGLALVLSAALGLAALLHARAAQEKEITLAARFLGVPADAVQLKALPRQVQPLALPTGGTPTWRKREFFAVTYADPAMGGKPREAQLTIDDGSEFIGGAYWPDVLDNPLAGRALPDAELRAKAERFAVSHSPLPGATARVVGAYPNPREAPVTCDYICDLQMAGTPFAQAQAIVTVLTATGSVGGYGYITVDRSQFAKVTVSREQAVAIATACFPKPPPGAEIRLDEHNTTLSDRSFCTKRGRPVWLVEAVAIPQPGGYPHPHAFVIDAITGKVVSNGAEGFHDWPPPPGSTFTVQSVALVTEKALVLDSDLVRVAWPEGSPSARQIHVRLSANSYRARYTWEGAGAARREMPVYCLELHSLDRDVPWQWEIGWNGAMWIPEAQIVAGKQGECYLAWKSDSSEPPTFAPILGGRDRDRAIREQVDAAWNGAHGSILVYIPRSALGPEVHGYANPTTITFHFKSIEKLEGGGWRVGYSGVDPLVTHAVVYDGKQWNRADQ